MTDRRAYLTQKKREQRARQKAAGRVSVTVWVKPEDREAVRAYAERLNADRAAWEEAAHGKSALSEPTQN